jgi:hypothetical protein
MGISGFHQGIDERGFFLMYLGASFGYLSSKSDQLKRNEI